MGGGIEEKGADTDPGKCPRGKFWKKILGEIPERERIGVSGKKLLIKSCGMCKLTIHFFLGQNSPEFGFIYHKSNGEDGEGEEYQW